MTALTGLMLAFAILTLLMVGGLALLLRRRFAAGRPTRSAGAEDQPNRPSVAEKEQ